VRGADAGPATPPGAATLERPDEEAREQAPPPPGTAGQVVEWVPEVKVEESRPSRDWTGVRTRMPIAYPMLRGDRDEQGRPTGPPRIVGDGDLVEFLASWDQETRRWYGPEAEHVEELLRQGMIRGSEAQQVRASQVAAIEHERGCWPTPDGKPALRPELRQRTKEQVQREWERVLAGGWAELHRLEAQEARSDRQENAAALRELADAIREGGAAGAARLDPETLAQAVTIAIQLMNERGTGPTAEFAGAQGPGSELKKMRTRGAPES
jgi:hypothetical protein